MKNKFTLLPFILLLICANALAQKTSYIDSINRWHQQRINDLRAPDGWINLTGLFWLQPGVNRLGSGTDNECIVQHPDMPEKAGYFEWTNQQVFWVTAPGVPVYLQNQPVEKIAMIGTDAGSFPQLSLKNFRWNIIVRGDKIGVRFRDLASPALQSFTDVPRFPVLPKWKIVAHFEPRVSEKIEIVNVLGQKNQEASPGKLVFDYQQKTYRLDVLEEGDQWFILFADATSGKTTYPTGRFLYVPKKNPGELVFIDFNQAFNPPCAFTSFATCPIPPPQNRLPFAITAGEKYEPHAKK